MNDETAPLPLLDPARANPAVREALAGEPPLKLLQAIANAQSAFPAWLGYANTLLRGLTLEPRHRELAMLQVAKVTPHSEYEWAQHVGLARKRGVTEEQLAAIDAGDIEADCFAPVDRMLLAFAAALARDGVAPRSLVDELVDRLSLEQVVETILLVSHMLLLARVSATFDLQPEAAAADQILGRPATTKNP